jgi:segregation and condensation protein B
VKASQIVEGVLFASDAPLKAEEIARADESLDEDRVQEAIQDLRTLYDESERAFQLVELGEGYQILTRSEFAPYLERFDTVPRPSRLSGPALETLAIIAYRQPIGRIEIEYIRGVQAAGVIRTLQDRDLIEVVGRAEGLGRPLLYGTTRRFLEHFGFASLDDLPRTEELPILLRDQAPLEELLEKQAEELEAESSEAAPSEAAPEEAAPEETITQPEGADLGSPDSEENPDL